MLKQIHCIKEEDGLILSINTRICGSFLTSTTATVIGQPIAIPTKTLIRSISVITCLCTSSIINLTFIDI